MFFVFAARLAISIARKIGATIFLVAEDLIELRARLIMTFAGKLHLQGYDWSDTNANSSF